MGDGHDGAGVALQELLQPIDRLGVQVIGRLIKQQHVGLGQQHAAQRHAALFTAGEQADFGVPRRQAQRVSGDFELVLGVGASGGDDGFEARLLGGQRVKVGVFFGVSGIHRFELGLGGKDCTHARFNAFAHRVLRVELGFLRQVADVQAQHRRGFAFDFLVQTGHDFEQGRFARAVHAQHADLGTGEKAQRDVVENLAFGRHDFADLVHGEYVLSHQGYFVKRAKNKFCRPAIAVAITA